MAFRHAKNAAFTLNAVVLTTFINSMELSFENELADTTTYGTTWKSGLTGIPGGTIELEGFYDPTASTGPGAVLFPLFTAGTPVTGLVYPGGTASGQILYTITTGCIVMSYTESSPVSDIVAWTASIAVTVLPVRTVI